MQLHSCEDNFSYQQMINHKWLRVDVGKWSRFLKLGGKFDSNGFPYLDVISRVMNTVYLFLAHSYLGRRAAGGVYDSSACLLQHCSNQLLGSLESGPASLEALKSKETWWNGWTAPQVLDSNQLVPKNELQLRVLLYFSIPHHISGPSPEWVPLGTARHMLRSTCCITWKCLILWKAYMLVDMTYSQGSFGVRFAHSVIHKTTPIISALRSWGRRIVMSLRLVWAKKTLSHNKPTIHSTSQQTKLLSALLYTR